jgi:sulfite exporter TauE/SafE
VCPEESPEMKTSTDIFLMGIMLGWGPCLSFCLPIITPLIAGTQKGWGRGLWSILVFSLSRILAYLVLAIVAAGIGQLIVRRYYESTFGCLIYPIVGVIVVVIGVHLALGRGHKSLGCRKSFGLHGRDGLKGMAILGLLIGFSPCVPLFGVLTYIALEARTLVQACYYGACFGVGTLLTPLIPVGALAGGIPSLVQWPRVFDIMRRLCGGYLVYVGVKLVLSGGCVAF